MKTLRYTQPPHFTLAEGDDLVSGGETFEVSNERAKELLRDPHVEVELVEEPEGSEQEQEPEADPPPDDEQGDVDATV